MMRCGECETLHDTPDHARLCGTIDRARAEGAAAERARLVAVVRGLRYSSRYPYDETTIVAALEAMGAAEGSDGRPPLPVREWRAPEDDGLED